MKREGRELEVCLFPVRAGNSGVEVFLGRMASGLNEGMWIPVGSSVDESSSPQLTVRRDAEALGFGADPVSCGLATEIGENGVWQTLLFLYRLDVAAHAEPRTVEPSAFDQVGWFEEKSLADLARPQADAVFTPAALRPSPGYEVTLHFDATNRLFRVDGGSPE